MKILSILKMALLLAGLMASLPVVAGHEEDEQRLLQSWGFRSDEAGRLTFDKAAQPPNDYRPWQPQLSRITPQLPAQQRLKPLQPLVVSAKKKHQE